MRKEDKVKQQKENEKMYGDKKPPLKYCKHCGGKDQIHVPFCPVTQ